MGYKYTFNEEDIVNATTGGFVYGVFAGLCIAGLSAIGFLYYLGLIH